MEAVLELYQEPYDPRWPWVCFDEKPCQLLAHTREPLPFGRGTPAREDYEYRRVGTCNVFMFFQPLRSWRHVEVRTRRTALDFAWAIELLLTELYPQAHGVRLVCDNLNTHTAASLYKAFPPEKARALARRLEFIYTPKHGSWLNMAEIELAALERQCLNRRIESQELLATEARAWCEERNARGQTVDWRYRTDDARMGLTKLYPSIDS